MKTFAAASLALALAFAGGTALACDHGDGGPKSPEKHLERMTEKLSLSPEQRDKVKVILEDLHTKHEAQRNTMRDEMKSSLATVLTPEQMTKLDQMHEEHMSKKDERKKERKDERKAERKAERGEAKSKE